MSANKSNEKTYTLDQLDCGDYVYDKTQGEYARVKEHNGSTYYAAVDPDEIPDDVIIYDVTDTTEQDDIN